MAAGTITMALTSIPEWIPTTEADIQLKAALQKLSSSTDAVMSTPLETASRVANLAQEKQQKRILLQSKSYFEISAN
jgi:hypothetical protein